MDIKRYIRDHEGLMRVMSSIYRVFGFNSVKGKSNLKILWGGYSQSIRLLKMMEKTTS